ncbi:hypothetical protein CEE37_14925 [candidate division LCP-89 bacterium B3_LCP]|uniref:Tyr recombinase domain-containing protein n=1 Tax=candidate division LCP-89 bacterium B3_LCP TaxID=2012998 RepID=A0A532UNQ5_UNCL8|nr:MAG: hypothetical protein CEE37_14925 [candidate division LCP-89 bacterium B3_LCP]
MQIIMALDHSKPGLFNYTAGYISRRFKFYQRKAGLREELHLHYLRHACATTLANQGTPPHKIKDFLGHSTLQVTQIYLPTSDNDMREVPESLTYLA